MENPTSDFPPGADYNDYLITGVDVINCCRLLKLMFWSSSQVEIFLFAPLNWSGWVVVNQRVSLIKWTSLVQRNLATIFTYATLLKQLLVGLSIYYMCVHVVHMCTCMLHACAWSSLIPRPYEIKPGTHCLRMCWSNCVGISRRRVQYDDNAYIESHWRIDIQSPHFSREIWCIHRQCVPGSFSVILRMWAEVNLGMRLLHGHAWHDIVDQQLPHLHP